MALTRRGFLGRLFAGLAASALAPAVDLFATPVEAVASSARLVLSYRQTLQLVASEALHILSTILAPTQYQLLDDAQMNWGTLVHQFSVDITPEESSNADTLEEFSERYVRPAMAALATRIKSKDITRFGQLGLPSMVESVYRVSDVKTGVSVRTIRDTRLDHITGEFRDILRFDVVCG